MYRSLLPFIAILASLVMTSAADEKPHSSPAEDLKSLQGDWKVASSIGGSTTLAGETPEFIQNLGNDRLQFRIEENRLSFECIRTISGKTATLCNDLPLPTLQEQVQNSVRGDRLMLLTQPDGKGLLASYRVDGDRFTLRYPAGCCSRSGNVISFVRAGK